MDSFFSDYWYFHLVVLFLGVLFWTMIGRAVLSIFTGAVSNNPVMKLFRLLTEWFVVLIRPITPRFIPYGLVPLYAGFWLIVLRVVFGLVMINLGLAPSLDAAPAG